MHIMRKQISALQDRATDTESRLRRNNIQIIGLPERMEGDKPVEFSQKLLINVLGFTDMSATFVVKKAHIISFRSPKLGGPPRPFLLRLLNYRARDCILTTARTRSDLQYENAKLLFFPDYPPEIQQQRRAYTEVRKRLRENGTKFSFIYPSKLRVTDGTHTQFFETPTAAAEGLDTR